ncbi:MAG TPA: hypothetical protein VL860_14160 [Planctomycetota bacterium]|nr:hypothetical protein [Planctomycetota bacterium]
MKLMAHPRLYASAAALARLAEPIPAGAPAALPYASRVVAGLAEDYKKSPLFDWEMNTHNAHLVRARKMQTRVVTLLTRWKQTGKKVYRDAAVAHVAEMGRWEYWSWISWRVHDPRPDCIFDLSYGENATTLAVAYDWLQGTLSPAEKKLFCAIAKKWVFNSYLNLDKDKHKDWWFKKPDTNWNTVCAGGAGLCALAFAEDFPRESSAALARTEESFVPYMKLLDQSKGGWPEGIGYWGYGMRYAWMYLLSWERATGKKHPLLKSPYVERTLEFPLDFLPNGAACSFGDVNRYWILPFHFAAAMRYGRSDLARTLDGLIARDPAASVGDNKHWPNAADLLIFHPRRTAGKPPAPRRNFAKAYLGQDWYILADRWPNPRLYLSVRGGTTEVPHGHIDLTSFHLVVGDENLLTTISAEEYLDTTFSPRRYELFEMAAPAKNMLLINGVGIPRPAVVKSKLTSAGGFPAVYLDATDAINGAPKGFRMADFYARTFVLLGEHGAVVLDRMRFPAPQTGRVEVRLQTYAKLTANAKRATAVIAGERQKLGVACAASVPGLMRTALPALTSPGKPLHTLRWGSQGLHDGMTLATLLTPGGKPGQVTLKESKAGLQVAVKIGAFRRTLRFKNNLQPK